MAKEYKRCLEIFLNRVLLNGDLIIPQNPVGVVIFAHGSGSSRHSKRNKFVANVLNEAGIGTFLFDLLTEREDQDYSNRFNIELLSHRLIDVTIWLQNLPEVNGLSVGYFGASTGAAAALEAAAVLGDKIKAIVSRGGRPDLASQKLSLVKSPTLLIVGGNDLEVLWLNQDALDKLNSIKKLAIIDGAGHLFEEGNSLEQAANLSASWFSRFLSKDESSFFLSDVS